MRNFRVIRIDAITGEGRLVADFLTESKAWSKADLLERRESVKPERAAWFAATNVDDYKALAREFFYYRRTFAY